MRRLSSKLTAVLAALLGSVSLICVGVSLHVARTGLQIIDQGLHVSLARETLAAYLPELRGSLGRGSDVPLFELLMAINPAAEFYLLDMSGTVVGYRAPPDRIRFSQVTVEPIVAFLDKSRPLPIVGDDPRDPVKPKVFSAARLEIDGRNVGYLYVILGGEAYGNAAAMFRTSTALQVTVLSLLGSLLVAFGIGVVLFRLLGRRLARLSNRMLAFEATGFRSSELIIEQPGVGDEIEELTRVYATLAERVAHQFTELERMDRSRRELLSHLSHDLRTPLATLQAYLETLLIKGSALTPEVQREYLTAAIQFSRKIDTMTSDLFEFATLNLHDAPIRPEQFFIVELLHDIVQRFALQAKSQSLTLEVLGDAPGPQIVADIGLIERLFANLIDNAVKFTGPGGAIKVSVTDTSPFVAIDVSDTGIGIPDAFVARVFDSFQRAAHDVATDGSGLGLAIAKRIVSLHGGRISVTSVVSVGTTFRVDLPTRAAAAHVRGAEST